MSMKKFYIKTWKERYTKDSSDTQIRQNMQDEIDELRNYIRQLKLKLNVLIKEIPLV